MEFPSNPFCLEGSSSFSLPQGTFLSLPFFPFPEYEDSIRRDNTFCRSRGFSPSPPPLEFFLIFPPLLGRLSLQIIRQTSFFFFLKFPVVPSFPLPPPFPPWKTLSLTKFLFGFRVVVSPLESQGEIDLFLKLRGVPFLPFLPPPIFLLASSSFHLLMHS